MPALATALDDYKLYFGLVGLATGLVAGIGWMWFTYKTSPNNPDQMMAGAMVAMSLPVVTGLASSSLGGKVYNLIH